MKKILASDTRWPKFVDTVMIMIQVHSPNAIHSLFRRMDLVEVMFRIEDIVKPLLFLRNINCDILLVSRFEFTGIMTTSFQLQSHKVVSYQHSISCIKTLSVGFPALCLLLHNRSIGRKVQTRELDIVDETVALDAFEKEMKKCFNKVLWNGCGYFS